ncbi:hypothetical protein NLI96_g9885 [Meripilus lineatus]|uniref:SH3 domain-containing protein n=1 Tax=Meripilus lineatus TaxID=2056292 RepID=A0AAD5UWC7_9APHY|nr:hypothetical protein NLI96_g9885 [Physisporinus lineatus]
MNLDPMLYFASRPELFNGAAGANGAGSNTSAEKDLVHNASAAFASRAAASAIHNAFSNSSSSSQQQQDRDSNEPPVPRWKKPGNSNSPSPSPALPSVGRVAAAAAAFGFNPGAPPPNARERDNDAPPPTAPRPLPPRRPSSTNEDSDTPSLPSRGSIPTTTGKLVQQKKFGDVDMSSGKGFFSSVRNSTVNKSATPPQVAPPTPAAFAPRANNYGPPPVRRVASTSAKSDTKSASPPAPPPAPPRRKEPEGEWAEALYDYTSDDPEDLPLEEGQRVLVTDRTSSDDWWIGEVDGRKGSFPAAYVKLL